jgi:peptidoglycan/LPS O-acetylase OafA/YrhL
MAILFMMSGILLKDKVEKYYKLWWLYIPLIACALLAVRFDIISHSLPYFTNRINIIYIYIPLYILLSYIGINFILGLSKQIKVSPLLEYLGRNSLVIFLLHFTFYQIFISYVLPYLGRSIYLSACIVALVYLLNVITCCGFAYLLNLKPLRWILGK